MASGYCSASARLAPGRPQLVTESVRAVWASDVVVSGGRFFPRMADAYTALWTNDLCKALISGGFECVVTKGVPVR